MFQFESFVVFYLFYYITLLVKPPEWVFAGISHMVAQCLKGENTCFASFKFSGESILFHLGSKETF